MTAKARVAVLLSGVGSNMEALVHAGRQPDAPFEVVLVLSNNPAAPGLARAEALGAPARTIDHRPFDPDRGAHERAIDAALRAAEVGWVALAGYMRVLTPFLVNAWTGRMLNIHPSLLPKYPGLNTHARALAAGDRVHGCTVHFVTEGVDAGAVLKMAAVPVLEGDTIASLTARVQAAEHELYPRVLARLTRSAF